MNNFEDFLIERTDAVDLAAYNFVLAIMNSNDEETLWNMELIGDVVDAVAECLTKKGKNTCYPYYCDSIPCYAVGDCKNSECPFNKKGKGEQA